MNKILLIILILILIFSILIYLSYQYYKYYNQKKLIKDFINNTDDLYNKFNLIERRASTTMRVSLSPVVGEMQNVLMDLDKINCPDYCLDCFSNLKKYFELVIEGYLQFMSMNEKFSRNLLEQSIIYKTKYLTSREELIKKY